MKVEIWSDLMCPFCYIGKRKFESALDIFEHRNDIEVEWRSFQLNPGMKTDPDKNIHQYLADIKGWTLEHAKEMNAHVTGMAKEAGLHYDFDKAVVANSFDAHRLIQYAKTLGKGDAAEERLFKAYFTEGRNTADHATLAELAKEIGLDPVRVKEILDGAGFSEAVKRDLAEAQRIGVRGVPFFVIDRKYAISGAQEPGVFVNALNRAWSENATPKIFDQSVDGAAACGTEGCD